MGGGGGGGWGQTHNGHCTRFEISVCPVYFLTEEWCFVVPGRVLFGVCVTGSYHPPGKISTYAFPG